MSGGYDDGIARCRLGDVRAVLPTLAAESVQCVVTSPPYWGLRDYGTATWTGGDPECEHSGGGGRGMWAGGQRLQSTQAHVAGAPHRGGSVAECRCGATRTDAQLGLEPTPEEYVANMVAVFREVRRVLRKDGTLWLNMGDCYATHPNGNGGLDKSTIKGGEHARRRVHAPRRYPHPHDDDDRTFRDKPFSSIAGGLKPKDLVGIPWRVAFALQADGWYLRSDIIWSKPNPMPESVTDRPTKAHEYLFLFTKSERYYYDAEAIAEASVGNGEVRGGGHKASTAKIHAGRDDGQRLALLGAQPIAATRNRRSVWTIPTQPYPEAHFATFPEELVEPCILAGTSERGCCRECGAPWLRVLTPSQGDGFTGEPRATGRPDGAERRNLRGGQADWDTYVPARTVGWRPACTHAGDPVPCTVLDPFCGSGTTLVVATRLDRESVGVELNAAYIALAQKRLANVGRQIRMVL